jgi:ceramide glucosyltransferase
MSFAVPFGILAAITGWWTGHASLGAALLAWTLINRMAMSVTVGWGVVRDRRALSYCWLYPLRDLMGFGFWLASYAGNTVDWRGEKYRLHPGGRMIRQDAALGEKQSVPPKLAQEEESVAVGVDNLS